MILYKYTGLLDMTLVFLKISQISQEDTIDGVRNFSEQGRFLGIYVSCTTYKKKDPIGNNFSFFFQITLKTEFWMGASPITQTGSKTRLPFFTKIPFFPICKEWKGRPSLPLVMCLFSLIYRRFLGGKCWNKLIRLFP